MASETIPAQTTLMTYKNLSKTGYTPIGIAGVYNAIHYGTLVIAEMYIDGNQAKVRVRNIDNGAITTKLHLFVIWQKN